MKIFVVMFFVLAVSFLSFSPALKAPFLNLDDKMQVIGNPDVVSFSADKIPKIFTSFYLAMYQPIPTLSFAMEYKFFGPNPYFYHLDAILLHLINIVLVFWLTILLFKDRWLALMVAALFSVWPTQVEAVAWISARSTLLSSLFSLLAIIFYLYFQRKNKLYLYFLSLGMFLLAVMSKVSVVGLPFILLALDYYKNRSLSIRKIVAKLPFFAISLVFGLVAFFARNIFANAVVSPLDLWQKIVVISHTFVWQVYKMILPIQLANHYQWPVEGGQLLSFTYGSLAIILMSVALVFYLRKKTFLVLIVVWLFFNLIFSVLIVPRVEMLGGDRYSYLAILALLWLIVFLKPFVVKKKTVIIIAFFLIVPILSYASYRQSQTWYSNLTIWQQAIRVFPGNSRVWSLLASEQNKIKDWKLASEAAETAIYLDKNNAEAYMQRGNAKLAGYKDMEGAVMDFEKAIKLKPSEGRYYFGVSRARFMQQNWSEAIRYSVLAEKLISDIEKAEILPGLFYQRGFSFFQLKKWTNAELDLTSYLATSPNEPSALLMRGIARVNMQNKQSGCSDIQNAVKQDDVDAKKYFSKLCK